MKRLVAYVSLLSISGCQLSAVPQLFMPPQGSGKVLSASPSPAKTSAGTPAPQAPASNGLLMTLRMDGETLALQGSPTGSGGSYAHATEGALGANQWNVKFTLEPASALQSDPIDPSALTLSGSFVVGVPDGKSGKIRQYVITNVTKLTKAGQIDSLTRSNGKLNLSYSATLDGIPSDGTPKKRFVLEAQNLPL